MNTEVLTLSEAGKYLGYHPKYLQQLDREGVLKASRTATNRRYYSKSQLDKFLYRESVILESNLVIAYCRVSTRNQIADLKNQRIIIEEFCVAHGLSNVEYIEEIGGGLNFKRKEFLKIIDLIVSGQLKTLVIAHKDRLVRFGFDLLEYLCKTHNVEILIINVEKLSPEAEMVQDLMTIIHCFSSRLYGLRNYRKSLKEALK